MRIETDDTGHSRSNPQDSHSANMPSKSTDNAAQANPRVLPPAPKQTELGQIPSENQSAPDNDQMLKRLIDGRYRIVKVIDTGGMASVYRAHDERLGRDVALKIMHPHLANTTSLVERFEAEARSAARLMHPEIVQIFDQGIWRRRPYLVMEFVNGPNLRQVLTREGTLSLGRALEITAQVLAALQAAHSMQIIHRDIKPENILLTPSGQVKVADFGLAHAVNQATGNTTGSVMGTVNYLAPELISQTSSDARCDVYSAGIMLYELISGIAPFQSDTAIRTAWRHVSEDVPPLSDLLPWIPSEVDDLIAALTARNASERPTDASLALELVQAVSSCLSPQLKERKAKRPQNPSLESETEHTPLGKGGTAVLPVFHLSEPDIPATPVRPPNPSSNWETGSSAQPVQPTSRPAKSSGNHNPAQAITKAKANGQSFNKAATTEQPRRSKGKKRWIWALVISLLLVSSGAIAGWYFTFGPGGTVTVPNIQGKTATQAESLLTKAQLKVKTVREYSDTVSQDKTIRTNPKAGSKARKNSLVTLYISRGIEYVKVPELVGKDQEQAVALLKEAKLKLAEKVEEHSDEVEKGKIISTDPTAGTSLRHDSPVKLTISKGKEPIKLPDLAGKNEAEATKILADLKVQMEKSTEYSDSVARGKVIAQEPAAESTVYHGDKVKVRISLGPEMVTVPNVSSLSMSEAKQKLESLGFQVKIRKELLGISPNRVYSQSPSGGTKLKSGSTVTLTYV